MLTKSFIKASELAAYCEVDLKTIHNWANKGHIVHFRTPGRQLRFQPAAVATFLEKHGYPVPADLAAARVEVAQAPTGAAA
ncbi:helix-turn-helix domain-containing protein [Sorangium sp. So ce134]